MILFGERSLRRSLSEYVDHYHAERNHQGKGNVLLFPRGAQQREGPVQRRERLGGSYATTIEMRLDGPHRYLDLTIHTAVLALDIPSPAGRACSAARYAASRCLVLGCVINCAVPDLGMLAFRRLATIGSAVAARRLDLVIPCSPNLARANAAVSPIVVRRLDDPTSAAQAHGGAARSLGRRTRL